jgi:hypothetical protein
MGLMAQCEQKTMYFDVISEDDERAYIDLASCMTALNRHQFHHVGRDGNPNCFRVVVQSIKGESRFSHASNAFITCNAVKQTTKGWKAQMRHAGIKLRDLPPYGRRPRFALEEGAWITNVEGGEDYIEIYDNLGPKLAPGGSAAFVTYLATDTNYVTYQHSPTLNYIAANQVTQVTVTDGAGNETNSPLVLLGTAPGEFNVVREYLRARRQTPDVSIDTPGPLEDSAMLNLFSTSEEMSDDIIDAIDDYMDYKPYTPDHVTNSFDVKVEGCLISSLTTGTSTNAAPAAPNTSTSNHYPPNAAVMDVPLGLLQVTSDLGSSFSLTVEAIYEM